MGEFEDKLNSILSNQEAMGQIMALAQSLGGGEKGQTEPSQTAQDPPPVPSAPFPALSGLDPKLMQLGMRLLQEYNRENDENAALLAALRPFVREKRYAKMDQAVRLAKMYRIVRVLLESLRENGGTEHV